MEKRVMCKMTRLPNVVGRVDYISNPKRQENLLGFYQTPEDPRSFWKALSRESQELSGYNKAQMEEHNKKEIERFEAGEIKHKRLLKTVEARELIVCLPNDLYGKVDDRAVAEYLAKDFKARYGIECAVGVHQNKERTNYHAHVILPERRMLEQTKESIATRNTYFDANGKRSTKKDCVDELGNLKPGCKLVKKGENLRQRSFSEKDALFASKAFSYAEKERFARLFNQMSRDHWVVYNHHTNPHIRYYSLKRGEPEALRAWKENENSKIRGYNDAIDRLMESGEFTAEQALAVKREFYAKRAAIRRDKREEHKVWAQWYESEAARLERARVSQARRNIRYTETGRERSTFELLVIFGLGLAGVNVVNSKRELSSDLIVRPRKNIQVKVDQRVQQMIDEVCIASGRRAPSEIAAEKRLKRLSELDKQGGEYKDLQSLIKAAEGLNGAQKPRDEMTKPPRSPEKLDI